MHHSPHTPARQSAHSHLLMIAGVIVVAAAMLVAFGIEASPAVIIGARVVLIAAAAFAVLALLRTIMLRGLRGLMHGPAVHSHGTAAHPHGGHVHTHDAHSLETEGITLSWPGVYDLQVGVMLGGRRKKLLDSILALGGIEAGSRVLDVGCGTGTLSVHAAKQIGGAEVSGIDASPEMIAYAQRKAERRGVRVDFRSALAESLPYDDGTFDVVMSSFVIHHLPGDLKHRAFAEMRRVLKPGGRAVLVDFEPPTRGLAATLIRMMVGEGMMHINNHTLVPLVQEAGFADVTLQPTGHSMATAIIGTKIS